MLDVCLLGTGGTVPLPNRWLTSLFLRWQGHAMLVDCGEGTQIALHQQAISCKSIDTILLTHYHTDHTAGLPGILLTMAKSERTEPVTIYGPKGLVDVMEGVYKVARYIPFEINLIEMTEKENDFIVDGLKIKAINAKHSVPCFAYIFQLDRMPKFDRQKAEALNIPMRIWGQLQKGNVVEKDGITYDPSQVLGQPRRGIQMVYATDTRPLDRLVDLASHADLYIGEGMYGDPEKIEKAMLNKHSTMQETAILAKKMEAKELWFTHYSPSVKDPMEYADVIHQIFNNAVFSHDGQQKTLRFIDEGE
ncbi:MAG: ribonuclease Z [Erysipelotrichaceae bacterium]|nr:ribonuclease Z [Erysipelotrichaceae bacterium]MDY6034391.1 ribonuclease Z [Bulleidia sp.]